jgi:DNA replication protein DnaC
MAEAWQSQQRDAKIGALSFDERFSLLVDAEYQARDNRRLTRLLKDAQLRIPQASVEDVEASSARGIDKSMLRQLGSCAWVGEHLNVLIAGATGIGKSYLACALGQSACRKGLRVLYRRVPRLLDEVALARAEGSYARLLAKLVAPLRSRSPIRAITMRRNGCPRWAKSAVPLPPILLSGARI